MAVYYIGVLSFMKSIVTVPDDCQFPALVVMTTVSMVMTGVWYGSTIDLL